MSDNQNYVQVSLPNRMAIMTEAGCHTIIVKADGMLEVRETLKGVVAVYASGFWCGASLLTLTTRETA